VIEADALLPALVAHLPKQRWFAGDEAVAAEARIHSIRTLREPWPGMVQVLLDAGGLRYQVLLGVREVAEREPFLEGKPEAAIGEIATTAGAGFAYDATVDPELALCILERVDQSMAAERARPLSADQSNTSIVFDEHLILKVFRRIEDGPNPDAEVTRALVAQGFDHVAAPVAEWRDGDAHLAVVSEFLVGAVDGLHLALTSLRDLYDTRLDPWQTGGDFGPDSSRLGEITGRMHLALAAAFDTTSGDGVEWAAAMERQLDRVPASDLDRASVRSCYERLRSVDVGPSIRVHGDYHLGQVLRTDIGWYVLDFEGEPARPLAERLLPSSALRDVAGMLRSFHYAAEIALREHGDAEDPELRSLAQRWEERNVGSFLKGYRSVDGIEAVLPASDDGFGTVLAAFTLDKAVYEVGYEASHRPDWVGIPLSAVRRILAETLT
jgi:maltokinase